MDMETLWDLIGRCSAFCPTSIVPGLLPVEVLTVNNRSYRVMKQVGSRSRSISSTASSCCTVSILTPSAHEHDETVLFVFYSCDCSTVLMCEQQQCSDCISKQVAVSCSSCFCYSSMRQTAW